jgi:phospholipid-transporting ATPase
MSSTNSNHPYVTHFFLNLALCNTVMVDYVQNNGKKEPKYKAASPDELALVLGAKNAGVHLISREHNRVKVYNSATKETLAFKVIAEFPFDSVRKRMSVILKDLQSGTYKILCKGADSVMMERMIFEKNGIEGLQSIINEDLYQYSCEGLRTLLFAHRNIIEEEF